MLVGPDLRQRDRVIVGGGLSPRLPGPMPSAAGPRRLRFCWHDLDLVVTVRRYWNWFNLRRRWLRLRDTVPQRDPAVRARSPKR